jgi:hypothetical protein
MMLIQDAGQQMGTVASVCDSCKCRQARSHGPKTRLVDRVLLYSNAKAGLAAAEAGG